MKYYLDTTGHAWSLPLYRSPGLSGSVLCVPAAPYQEDTVCGRSHLFRGAATARFGVKSWCTSLALWEHANTNIKWACTCVDSERMCVCARAYMKVNKRGGLCLLANAVVVRVFVGLFLFYFQKVLVHIWSRGRSLRSGSTCSEAVTERSRGLFVLLVWRTRAAYEKDMTCYFSGCERCEQLWIAFLTK